MEVTGWGAFWLLIVVIYLTPKFLNLLPSRTEAMRRELKETKAALNLSRAENARFFALIASWNKSQNASTQKAFQSHVDKFKPKCWDVLQLTPNSSEKEIKSRFASLAKAHHPDHGGNPATFRRILQARDEALKTVHVHA